MRSRVPIQKSAAATPPAAAPAPVSVEKAFEAWATANPGPVPPVLTSEAIAAGYMPPPGQSGMPPSLEESVPAEFRYWEAGEKASEVRKALVEGGLFIGPNLQVVNGVLRRVMRKTFLVEVDPPTNERAFTLPLGDAEFAATCLRYTEKMTVYQPGAAPSPAEVAKAATGGSWLAAWPDSAEIRKALLGAGHASVFEVRTRPGVVFASNVELDPEARYVARIEPCPEETKVEQLMKGALHRRLRLVKSAVAPIEERYVLGVVLEPETQDSQKDIYSAEEVRKAAHRFLEWYRLASYLGAQHTKENLTGKIVVLESYIAPVDFLLNGETIRAGTWLLAVRIVDDTLWESVKKGDFTGFSIGGDAIRLPDPVTAPAVAAAA